MNTLLQIIVSIILFGLFLIIVLSFDGNVASISHQMTFDKNSQENIVDLIELFDNDFTKIGYKKQGPKLKSGCLDSTSITWYSDHDNNGSMDSIRYYLGDLRTTGQPNNNIRYLFRKINNENPIKVGLGFVYFNLSYFDSTISQISYSQLSNPNSVKKIRGIKIRVRVETQYKYSNNYGSAFWEKMFLPRNLTL